MRAASQTWVMLFDSWFWDFLVFLKQLRSYYPWCKVRESKFTLAYQCFKVCSHLWVAQGPLSQEQRTVWLEGITSEEPRWGIRSPQHCSALALYMCSMLSTAPFQAWEHGFYASSPKEITLLVIHGHWHSLGNPSMPFPLTTECPARLTALPGVAWFLLECALCLPSRVHPTGSWIFF